MFAPHHQEAADELVRVTRPGGRIGLISWTPTGFIGQLFATMKPFAAPAPAETAPPAPVRVAAQPADHEHRFGHGKAEALAALVQVILITFSALFIAFRSAQRLIGGASTSSGGRSVHTSGVFSSKAALTIPICFGKRSRYS